MSSTQANIFSIDGVIPVVHPESFVHPNAVLIGDVIIGKGCYVGSGACLRGDFSRITVGDESNVQENCVVHSFPNEPVDIAPRVIVAHGAILHGCKISSGSLIGMHAVVLDGVHIAENNLIAATSLVAAGMHTPANSLIAGTPAKVVRELTQQELIWQQQGLASYHKLTQRCLTSMQRVTPLAQIDAQRPTLNIDEDESLPLHQFRAKQ